MSPKTVLAVRDYMAKHTNVTMADAIKAVMVEIDAEEIERAKLAREREENEKIRAAIFQYDIERGKCLLVPDAIVKALETIYKRRSIAASNWKKENGSPKETTKQDFYDCLDRAAKYPDYVSNRVAKAFASNAFESSKCYAQKETIEALVKALGIK